jgi:LL-diaminopimelate aminotransferase
MAAYDTHVADKGGTMFTKSQRLQELPPYLFAEIDKKKREARAAGRDIIDLGVGDPDRPTPAFIIEALAKGARDASNHRYALDQGKPELREAFAIWCKRRYGVDLDPGTEILPLIGTKEGIAHLPLAVMNPGDASLVPDPCYPPYKSGSSFAGGEPVIMPLLEENGFLPDLDAVPDDVRKRATLMFLNYPNNPTGAVAGDDFFAKAVGFAARNGIVLAHDAAYNELVYEEEPVSILSVPGAKECCIEFHSLSKTFNMTGWRIGFAVGSKDVVGALGQVKSNLDSGIFGAVQEAGIAALGREGEAALKDIVATYRSRRDVLVDGLKRIGWKVNRPRATFYVWIAVPEGHDSTSFAAHVLDRADMVLTPGLGFGASGEGYVRAALTVEEARLEEAVDRLGRL